MSGTMTGSDTLVFDDFYDIDHRTADGQNIAVPAGASIIADQAGDGFDVLTSGTGNNPVFNLGANCLLDELTVTASLAPNTGYTGANPVNGTDYHGCRIFRGGGDNLIFRRLSMSGQVNMHIDLDNCADVLIEQCIFTGGFYQVRQVGDSDNLIYRYNHGKDGVGDCLKTSRNASTAPGPRYQTISNCLFEGMNRDGLDTTGGFKEAVVEDCVFWELGVAGCDFKAIYENPIDANAEVTNNNGIRVNRCQFVDIDNAMVITTLDRFDPLLIQDSDDALQYMPNDIVMTDCVTEITDGTTKRQILLKDGYDIHWVDSEFYGSITDVNILNDLGVPGWSATDVNGNVATTGSPRGLSVGDLWDYSIGPGSTLIVSEASPAVPKIIKVGSTVLAI